jgi:molybdate transport system substrate-binding protein
MGKALWVVLLFVFLSFSVDAAEISIGAGAGLKDVLTELSTIFEKERPSIHITKNFAASGMLAKQIDNGAVLDIVFVANREWMDYLVEKKHVDAGSVSPFAYNTLVFVGPSGKQISGMNELVKLDKIAIGSPKSVPAGEYAMVALKKAALDKQLEKKLVMARDVRECLMYAERGEVDGAFVYKTDAMLSKVVKIQFSVPQALYSRVVYLTALTISGIRNQEAGDFFGFLRSVGAKDVLMKYGFELQ